MLSAHRAAASCSAEVSRSARSTCTLLPCTSDRRAVSATPAALRSASAAAAPSIAPVRIVRAAKRITTAAAAAGELAQVPSTASGKLISKTETSAFIQRDDMMDQVYRWAMIEAGESGIVNFGMPMTVEPFYKNVEGTDMLWGYKVAIFKEGNQKCDLAIMFDSENVDKHEWIGRGDDGFPTLEGKTAAVVGKHFEIWKICTRPVDEELRSVIRSFCTALVSALNRYYAFGSVFVDDAQ